MSQPISRRWIKEGLRRKGEDGEVITPSDEEIRQVEDQLEQIQQYFENHLRSVLGNIYSARVGGPVEVIKETPELYYIGDQSGEIYNQFVREGVLVDDVVRAAHNKQVSWNIASSQNSEFTDQWVALKPSWWEQGQWAADAHLSGLVEKGLSGTQALDYWMVRVREKSVNIWAGTRDRTAEAVRQNVEKAESLLENASNEEMRVSDEINYFERTYRGDSEAAGHSNRVTADYAHLSPRRDITDASRSGDFTWGYNGSGPTQLSVALLADALGTSDLDQDMWRAFRDYTTSFGDQWKITDREIRNWVDKYDRKDERGDE